MQVFQLCSLLCAVIKLVVSCDWLPAECSWALGFVGVVGGLSNCLIGSCGGPLKQYWFLELLGLQELIWCTVPPKIHPVLCVLCPVCGTLD